MKTILYVVFLSVLHQYDCKATIKDMHLSERLCLEELHLKFSEVSDIANFEKETVDTPNTRSMLACLFSKMGVLDHEEKISEEGFDNLINVIIDAVKGNELLGQLTRKSLSKCKDIEARSGGEVGLRIRDCMKNAGMEVRNNYKKNNNV